MVVPRHNVYKTHLGAYSTEAAPHVSIGHANAGVTGPKLRAGAWRLLSCDTHEIHALYSDRTWCMILSCCCHHVRSAACKPAPMQRALDSHTSVGFMYYQFPGQSTASWMALLGPTGSRCTCALSGEGVLHLDVETDTDAGWCVFPCTSAC
jgi:hypothetical protein